jgi:hypothetical protein
MAREIMEAERKREKKERQVSEKRTPFNIKEEKSQKAAEERENSPALQALHDSFLPGAGNRGRPKFITDKYGNRVRSGMESK